MGFVRAAPNSEIATAVGARSRQTPCALDASATDTNATAGIRPRTVETLLGAGRRPTNISRISRMPHRNIYGGVPNSSVGDAFVPSHRFVRRRQQDRRAQIQLATRKTPPRRHTQTQATRVRTSAMIPNGPVSEIAATTSPRTKYPDRGGLNRFSHNRNEECRKSIHWIFATLRSISPVCGISNGPAQKGPQWQTRAGAQHTPYN